MNHRTVTCVSLPLLLCLPAFPVSSQEPCSFAEGFEGPDPFAAGDWIRNGSTVWIPPGAAACTDPNTEEVCNLHSPGEGYVRLTPAVGNRNGNVFYSRRRLPFASFHVKATVELRDGATGRPGDGMAIVLIGGESPPAGAGVADGGMGAIFPGGHPEMVFAFDDWSGNGWAPAGDNIVAFTYSKDGFAGLDHLPYQAYVDLPPPQLLNSKQPPPSPPNRFTLDVGFDGSFVACSLSNEDAGLASTVLFTAPLQDFEPFEGWVGVTASTSGTWQNHLLHSIEFSVPDGSPPPPPGELRASGGVKKAHLVWTPPSVDCPEVQPDSYSIYRSTVRGGPYERVAVVPASESSYTDDPLPNNRTFCYQVRSKRAERESPPSNESCAYTEHNDAIVRRGDADGSGEVDLSDAIAVLGYLFLFRQTPGCLEAADRDDNGVVDITDAIGILNFLFLGGPPPAPPGPFQCGIDPMAPYLLCAVSNCD